MDIRFKVESADAIRAFEQAPEVMTRNLERVLSHGAEEVARAARGNAPKAFSNLVNSIHAFRVAPLHWRVAPGVNYAGDVEEGTKPGYMPNPTHLYAWVKQRSGVRFGETRSGSAARQAQYDDVRDRAWALARHIKAHGTKAHPYMAPAARDKESRVFALLDEGVDAGLREVFGR